MTPYHNPWLDRIAADLVSVERDLRARLRAIAHDRSFRRPQHVQLALHQARTLLRGAMPVPIGSTTLRHQHARMLLRLERFALSLLVANDPLHDPLQLVEAAADLVDQLRHWMRELQWQRATRRAGVKGWKLPQLPIRAVMQPETPEHEANATPRLEVPNVQSGRQHPGHQAAAALAQARRIRPLPAVQLQLALPPPQAPEVIDLRQLRLALAA